jgi:hypothetical protein
MRSNTVSMLVVHAWVCTGLKLMQTPSLKPVFYVDALSPELSLSLFSLSFVSTRYYGGSGKPNKDMVGQFTKAQVEVRREKEGGCSVHYWTHNLLPQ